MSMSLTEPKPSLSVFIRTLFVNSERLMTPVSPEPL